jgi:hypothetical protein
MIGAVWISLRWTVNPLGREYCVEPVIKLFLSLKNERKTQKLE